MYGSGVENIGHEGEPETAAVPEPADDQLLVRVDSVGMCFSDVKLIRQGGNHPKLYNRDLAKEPTRLGHEAALTILKVGQNLQDQYQPGQRVAMQPDIYQNGKSTAYGYTIPGGLIQYHLIGPEVLDTDAGACLLPLAGEMGYAETALLEPWGCVMASYTQRRRLTPQMGGIMWIIGHADDATDYTFSAHLDAPTTIILTDAPAAIQALVAATDATVVERNGLNPDDYANLATELTDGAGFDDIVLLDPHDANQVHEAGKQIKRRGTLNLVGKRPLNGHPPTDVGRLHYDYIAYVGNNGTDISASYGEERNRCELRANGSTVVIGAGGPMGMMHVQRAIELPAGPRLIIATEMNDLRLEALQDRFVPLAEKNGRKLVLYNPKTADSTLYDFTMRHTDNIGADDVVVCVPAAPLMAEAGTLMNPDGMLVLFAGVPNGTMAPLDVSNVYLANAQFTGTSGLTIHDQALVMERTLAGELSPSHSVAAIGGMEAAKDGIIAMMESRYPGKIVIFPQISGLPLTGLNELADRFPDIAQHLGEGNSWTDAAEQALIEAFWS